MRGAPGVSARPKAILASRLVGRAREFHALRQALQEASGGRGGVVFIVGEAGIGKSRLVREATAWAEERGFVLAGGRAVQATAPAPYRPLAEALCSAVRRYGAPQAPELEPFRPALGRLVPEWRGSQPEAEPSVVTLSEGIVRFFGAVTAGPGCLVVLEDLHWADPESLGVVEYLADNLAAESVVCLATARSEEASPALDLARALQSRRAAQVIEPARLTDRQVAEMVTSCLDTASLSDAVLAWARRSEGVPFLVEELLAVAVAAGALVDDGGTWSVSETVDPVVPLTFGDGIRRRLGAMDGDGRAVLFAAAVLGRRFDWRLLPSITGLGDEAVLSALHAAVDAQIVAVEREDDTFRFRHALSRDAVLASLLPPERASWCARALEAIERARPELDGDACELAAELAEGAGDRSRAAALFLDAARRALDAGALVTAEGTLDRARLLAPAGDRIGVAIDETLAEVLSLAGKRDEALRVCESLLAALGDESDAAGRRAQVHVRLARAAVAATRFEEALVHLDRARLDARSAADEPLQARIDALAAQAAMGLDRIEEAAALAQTALEAAERLRLPEVACEALEILGRWRRPFNLADAEATFAKAHAIAEEHGLTFWRARALHELGTIDMLRGGDVTRLEESRRLATGLGALATAAVVDVQIAASMGLGDDLEGALVAARRGADLARRYGLGYTLTAAIGFEALAHARMGRRDQVDRCLAEALGAAPDSPDLTERFALVRGVLALVEEDRATAVRQLRSAATAMAEGKGDRLSGPVPGIWVLLAAVEHDGVAMALDDAGDPVHYLGRAYLRYARAVLAGRAARTDEALVLIGKGDRLLGTSPWFRQYGRRLLAEAAVTDGWGSPAEWLREALSFFQDRGDERVASACRSLLRRCGVAVPRRRGDGVAPELASLGVTAREVEVLRLLAEGLNNRDIAQRLYLSPRTVERHIANLSVKTGVDGRAQLVAFAARSAARGVFGG